MVHNSCCDLWQGKESAQRWCKVPEKLLYIGNLGWFRMCDILHKLHIPACDAWQISESAQLNRVCDTWLCTFTCAYRTQVQTMFACHSSNCLWMIQIRELIDMRSQALRDSDKSYLNNRWECPPTKFWWQQHQCHWTRCIIIQPATQYNTGLICIVIWPPSE